MPKVEDKWVDKPVFPKGKGGIWTRARARKNSHGNWVRVGRLIKKYYCDKY